MPSASIIKKIPCSKINLINMVLDIEKYPEFVPWCLGGKIHSKVDKIDIIELINSIKTINKLKNYNILISRKSSLPYKTKLLSFSN